jgi:hypothetical protein
VLSSSPRSTQLEDSVMKFSHSYSKLFNTFLFFFVDHVFFSLLAYVAFFITICYHTSYAPPWIFPPLAFYGLDILMRIFRQRIKDAILVPIDNQMTLVSTPATSLY